MRFASASLALLALGTLAGPAPAQDMNVKFGGLAPSATYGAASGNAGYWNPVGIYSGPWQMLDLASQPTSVSATISQAFGCDIYFCGYCSGGVCPGTFGTADDAALLGSWVNADCYASVTAYQFSGLEPGRYVAHTYTYGCPSAPGASTYVNTGDVLQGFSTAGLPFQGTWTGFPVGRFVVNVGSWGLEVRCGASSETGLAGMQLDKLDPVGVASCLGDGTGGACPCANYGQPGAGCANSSSTHGALLGGLGAASLGSETLGFQGSFAPPNVSALLLQGDQLVAPIVFGDGLRCIGGHLKRMYLATISATGEVFLPANGGVPVSARSAALGDPLAAGDLRGYQLYYRDNSASFCPAPQGSTFSISNAVAITWQP